MAQFIGYEGYLFIDGSNLKEGQEFSDPIKLEELSDALVNDPTASGQLGFICEIDKCQFNKEALDIIKSMRIGSDSLGDFDVNKSDKGKATVMWLGGIYRVVDSTTETSRDFNLKALANITPIDLPIDEQMKTFLNSQKQE